MPGRPRSDRGALRAFIKPSSVMGIVNGSSCGTAVAGMGWRDFGGASGAGIVLRRGSTVFRKEVKTSGTSFGGMERSLLFPISGCHVLDGYTHRP